MAGGGPETVVVGGTESRRERDAVPLPLIVLGVVLAASLAFGAWLNDAGPWAPKKQAIAGPAIAAYNPPPGGDPFPTPVISDQDRTTLLVQSVFGDVLSDYTDVIGSDGAFDSTAESGDGVPDMPLRTDVAGLCSLRVVPNARSVELGWLADQPVPDDIHDAMNYLAGARDFDVTRVPAVNSRAEQLAAADALQGPKGDKALRSPRSVARNELPEGLVVTRAEVANDRTCTGVDVWYARADHGALTKSPERDSTVARVLEDDVSGGVPVTAHRDQLAEGSGKLLPSAGRGPYDAKTGD